MIWRIISITGLMIFIFITIYFYRNYRDKTGRYPSEIVWIGMIILGVIFVISMLNFGDLQSRMGYILIGFYTGAMISIRLLVGKESEREVKKDMTKDENIEWRESSFEYGSDEEDR